MNAPSDECMHICLAVLSAQHALLLNVAALWEHAPQTTVQTRLLIYANNLWCSYLCPGSAGTGIVGVDVMQICFSRMNLKTLPKRLENLKHLWSRAFAC